jgi:carotenoid cleavage dioxygenase-like enzyme
MTDLQLGFRTLDDESSAVRLAVDGEFPGWLEGALLRTGPARFEAGTRGFNHWFDGLAMLHRFGFAGGAVTYTSRFLDSPAYRAVRDTGRIGYSEFATDPCRTLFQRVSTAFSSPRFGANGNVNVLRLGDEIVALTESPLPVRFDPETLAALGVAAPAPGQLTVAHPHRAPLSGEMVSYAVRFGARSSYRVYTGDRKVLADIPASRPSYMHSFAVTERYMVLVEFPFVVMPVSIPLSSRPFIRNYHWRPSLGTKFRVLDLATGAMVGTAEGEPFFAFHHVNAFERGGEIILDVCGYDDAGIIDALYLDRLRASGTHPAPRLRRYRLRPDGGEAVREPLPDISLELPRIDYRSRNGRAYRYAYGIGTGGEDGFPDRLLKADLTSGTTSVWCEPDTYPGEPVFVRVPGEVREDGGILLSVVLDPARESSFLLALDAADLREIARARVPHHIPFGFHGNYFPAAHLTPGGASAAQARWAAWTVAESRLMPVLASTTITPLAEGSGKPRTPCERMHAV